MPRYLVERRLGAISDAELQDAAQTSQRIRERDFPAVGWEHSHVVRADGQLVSYCVYEAPDTQSVRDHAAAAGLPVDRVLEIHADLRPDEL
jgi:hypothetical protein